MTSEMTSRSSVIGAIERVTPLGISGWAVNLGDTRISPEVELLVDGQLCSVFRMHLMHPELEQILKLPPGTLAPAAFSIRLPAVARAKGKHTITMRCASTLQAIGKPYSYLHKPSFLSLDESKVLPALSSTSTTQQLNSRQSIRSAKGQSLKSEAKPLVSAIVLNRDGADCLEALLESWHKYNTVPAELIIIDHASRDHSHQVVQGWSDRLDLRWVALKINDSFSASSNLGAKLAKAPHLLFLNNDIVWVQDVLPAMLQTLQQRTQVAVGLKLLRHDGQSSNPVSLAHAPVQHLGVRLTLSDHLYWPYECSPENVLAHDELFAPQNVPAVTAAVMLMRAPDFKRLGGFDERYFYGYEDVELCLRACQSKNTRRQITCRNDLVALHRHGHSRLSGRQPDVTRKLSVNQQVFARELGLWAKQAWWQSLMAQDRMICGETLTLGIVYDDCPIDFTGEISLDIAQSQNGGQTAKAIKAQAAAQTWATKLSKAFGQARLLLYPRSAGWGDFSQAHMLWVLVPEWAQRSGSELREETGLRADCRVVAVIGPDSLEKWSAADASVFCSALAEPSTSSEAVRASWPACPSLLPSHSPDALKGVAQPRKRLFIAMHVDLTDRPAKVRARRQVQEQGRLLQLAAEQMGLLAWSESFSPADRMKMPVAELVVHIWPSSATGIRRHADDLQDAHYVAWISGGVGQGSTNKALQGFDQCWSTSPFVQSVSTEHRRIPHRIVKADDASVQSALKSVLKTVEKRIGRAFSAS